MICEIKFFFSLITLFLSAVQLSNAWPSGAPEKVCDTLTPKHGNNQPKLASDHSGSPFVITQSHSTYQPGERVQVVVQAPEGYSFRGLIVQAYDPLNNQPIGSFSSGRGLKTIDSCSAVTHTDRKGKRSATLIWDSPDGISQPGQVAFRATIVQRFNEFYTGLEAIPDSKA